MSAPRLRHAGADPHSAARHRPSDRDLLGALCAWACLALCVVGAALALLGASELHDGGGDPARCLALAGLALLMGGAGGCVLLQGGRRG